MKENSSKIESELQELESLNGSETKAKQMIVNF